MPQMAPLGWITLFFFSLMTMGLIFILLNFNKELFNNSMQMSQKTMQMKNWMW